MKSKKHTTTNVWYSICIVLVLFIIWCLVSMWWTNTASTDSTSSTTNTKHNKMDSSSSEGECSIPYMSQKYGDGKVWPPDILNNQYAQPIRDSRYTQPFGLPSMYTNVGYVNTSYRQVGILDPCSGVGSGEHRKELLVLMGRPLYVNRNKWQYYAITDQRNGLKLTIYTNDKPATNEYGVDEIYTNDRVKVQGYSGPYRVDMYENNYVQYM